MSCRILSTGVFLLMACCLSLPAGCSRATGVGEEDEHLEHYIPPHKPQNFRELVEQLSKRVTRLAGATDPSAAELQELRDIIDWIPELAADSELLKADWELAERTGKELQQSYLECFGTGAASQVRSAAPQKFSAPLNVLQQLSLKSETEPQNPPSDVGIPE
jgi:hypothetical protein